MPNPPTERPVSPLRASLLLAAAFIASYVLATWLTVVILSHEGLAEALSMGRGPHKIMRRLQLAIVLLTIPWILRRTCWAGWRDVGWTPAPGSPFPRSAWRHLLSGFAIGAAMLGLIALISLANGRRVIESDLRPGTIVLAALSALLSSLLIGIFEETVARGILFRALARLWRLWPAALVSSVIFSLGHFLKPLDEAFLADSWTRATLQALASNWERFAGIDFIALRVFNLALMAVVLCAVVMRTRTIWFAAGLHAGWVWVKLFNPDVTRRAEPAEYSLWTGLRTDVTDSLLGSLLLALLLAIVICWPRRSGEGRAHAP